ncbi:dimethyl sulfoxide reductase anchor subunit family protein [Marinovum sp.]|uniref:dimethyl sulfoxide reductase anchor subunit family protein n=1 Tax=Marinovum sp. TaxID=2024839 RepID=UPI002B26756E|nr:DmsC/YnfH family molybdoenzyme membrane anchor subunit [Marinovum sp.]
MHPAYSVILFTTSSGAGYGLLFWLSLAHLAGAQPVTGWSFFTGLLLALGLITLGLLSSTFHLGRPERAWRALSQWRSSWLSREGVVAIATYAPAGLLWLLALFGGPAWLTLPLAVLAALGAVATVWCTGMIYGSLRTIREWHQPLVPVLYLANAAASGAVLLVMLQAFAGRDIRLASLIALLALITAGALKLVYWRRIDADPGAYTVDMALGLEGVKRQLEPPHSRPNYVMREMGYDVARKHAETLRRTVLIWGFVVPGVMLAFQALTGGLGPVLMPVVVLAAAAGLVVERWLFFAEASHVSMLYYGAERA